MLQGPTQRFCFQIVTETDITDSFWNFLCLHGEETFH